MALTECWLQVCPELGASGHHAWGALPGAAEPAAAAAAGGAAADGQRGVPVPGAPQPAAARLQQPLRLPRRHVLPVMQDVAPLPQGRPCACESCGLYTGGPAPVAGGARHFSIAARSAAHGSCWDDNQPAKHWQTDERRAQVCTALSIRAPVKLCSYWPLPPHRGHGDAAGHILI